MAKSKLTNVQTMDIVIANIENIVLPVGSEFTAEDFAEKLDKIKASFEKKSHGDSAKAKANVALAEKMLSEMVIGEAMTVTEMTKNLPSVVGLSTQKVSPLVQMLLADGKVTLVTEGRVKKYAKA